MSDTRVLLGIDPGADTGLAIFRAGDLAELRTIAPVDIERVLIELAPVRIVVEDSRLQSRMWNARSKSTLGASLAAARSVGQVDAWCSLITALCARHGISMHSVSPAGKGAKLDAERFAAVTGWTKRCNQHERDSAMCAWPYRRARALL